MVGSKEPPRALPGVTLRLFLYLDSYDSQHFFYTFIYLFNYLFIYYYLILFYFIYYLGGTVVLLGWPVTSDLWFVLIVVWASPTNNVDFSS